MWKDHRHDTILERATVPALSETVTRRRKTYVPSGYSICCRSYFKASRMKPSKHSNTFVNRKQTMQERSTSHNMMRDITTWSRRQFCWTAFWSWFGIHGSFLSWFKSYLSSRSSMLNASQSWVGGNSWVSSA